jgi:hypothetical protein
MPQTLPTAVKDLRLDLKNFRTVPQPDEIRSVQAFVSIDEDRFWALMDSLLEEDGYLPTENVLVLKSRGKGGLVVKDGNRRIAALKLIHGYLPTSAVSVPSYILSKIGALTPTWKKANEAVPCAIYNAAEAATVDRIVTLAHGKGEKAGKNAWTAVARARHNRDVNNGNEPALDLLEKYLHQGKNITSHDAERWAGAYPLSVLEEAMKRLAQRVGAISVRDFADKYPAILHRDAFEKILNAIGNDQIGFPTIRQTADFAIGFGFPAIATQPTTPSQPAVPAGPIGAPPTLSGPVSTPPAASPTVPSNQPPVIIAVAMNDPRAVKRTLRSFVPRGNNRSKVVTLLDEARKLDVAKTPLAFCFLLRSMFEISAKAYCDDHNISTQKQNGENKFLVELLRDVTNHLTNQKKNKAMVKELHGALAELAKQDGMLSVTSMNQLVHNPAFSIIPGDVALLFGNVFPLLSAMNR